MNAIATGAGLGLLSYLLGAVPFGFLIARARGVDIRKVGSGNIGATNVFRMVGKPWGILTFSCDFLKGLLPAFLFPRLAISCAGAAPEHLQALSVIGAVGAVVGHNWPVYLGFKGGKGVATSAGALLGFAWQAVLAGLVSWVAVFLLTRYVSVASILAAVAIAASSWWLYASPGRLIPITLTLLGVLAVWRHTSNIQRLANGTEHRFEFRKKRTDAAPPPHDTPPA